MLVGKAFGLCRGRKRDEGYFGIVTLVAAGSSMSTMIFLGHRMYMKSMNDNIHTLCNANEMIRTPPIQVYAITDQPLKGPRPLDFPLCRPLPPFWNPPDPLRPLPLPACLKGIGAPFIFFLILSFFRPDPLGLGCEGRSIGDIFIDSGF